MFSITHSTISVVDSCFEGVQFYSFSQADPSHLLGLLCPTLTSLQVCVSFAPLSLMQYLPCRRGPRPVFFVEWLALGRERFAVYIFLYTFLMSLVTGHSRLKVVFWCVCGGYPGERKVDIKIFILQWYWILKNKIIYSIRKRLFCRSFKPRTLSLCLWWNALFSGTSK